MSTLAMKPRSGLGAAKATLRRSWPVLISYGVFSMWGVGCLFMSLMLTSGGFGMSPGNVTTMFGVLVATVAGHVFGNALGLAGLRLAPVVVLFIGLFIGSTLSGVVLGPIALFLIIAIFAALGGYLGIASRLDVVAAWYPLTFSIGGAIHWMNHHHGVETFNAGAKHALWDPFTIVCLLGTVFFMLTFLATRNSLGLTVWQEVAQPPMFDAEAENAVGVARPGRGSFVVLFLFTIAVLGATALVSPYLFRTREPDNKDQNPDGSSGSSGHSSGGHSSSGSSGQSSGGSSGESSSGSSGQSSGGESSSGSSGESSSGHSSSGSSGQSSSGHSSSGSSGQSSSGSSGSSGQSSSGSSGSSGQSSSGSSGSSGQSSSGSSGSSGHSSSGSSGQSSSGSSGQSSSGQSDPIGNPDTDHAGEAAAEAMNLGMKLFIGILLAALALLLFFLIVVPPVRRAFLMRHLERPLWPVAPTARAKNQWRRALAMLAVVDIEPAAGETPPDFARRAEQELQTTLQCPAPGIKEAAAIIERIDYAGRGLGADDEQAMKSAIDQFVSVLRDRIELSKRFTAAWSRTPEVES